MLHDRDRRVLGDPFCQLVLVVAIHAHAISLVAPERQFKFLCEKGRERKAQGRYAHCPVDVVAPETVFRGRRCPSPHLPIFRGCDADVEQVFPVTLEASVPRHQRQALVEPPAVDAVRDRVPVDEIQDMIGQQGGVRRQDGPRLVR